MGNQNSIFERDEPVAPAAARHADTPHPAFQPKKKSWWARIPFAAKWKVFLGLAFAGVLALEMFAPEMYKPSTWIGTRLGLTQGQTAQAAADDQIAVQNRQLDETADTRIDVANRTSLGTSEANIAVSEEQQATQADLQLLEAQRQEAVLSDIRQAIALSNNCENRKLQELHAAELSCDVSSQEPYTTCLQRIRGIEARVCPPLPNADDYPESLRDHVRERVRSAESLRQEQREAYEQGG